MSGSLKSHEVDQFGIMPINSLNPFYTLSDGLDHWAGNEEASGLDTNAVGVRVQLSTGQVCQIRIDTKIRNKVLDCLTPLELENFMQQIALAVENPSDTLLCEL